MKRGPNGGRFTQIFTVQLPMQSVPITTNVVSLNPAHGEVYSIQHYGTGRLFSPGTPISSTNKTVHDIAEILLKVALYYRSG